MLEALGLNLKEIIFVIVNFLVLVFVLGKFIYQPFLGALDNRKKRIQDTFAAADAVSRRADAKLAKYERRIAHVEDESRAIMKEAKKRAEEQAQQIVDDATKQASDIVTRAQRAIEQERLKALDDMREEIATLALLAAEQIVEKEVDKSGQDAIIENVIEDARRTTWQTVSS